MNSIQPAQESLVLPNYRCRSVVISDSFTRELIMMDDFSNEYFDLKTMRFNP
jgi:hypothetical protein